MTVHIRCILIAIIASVAVSTGFAQTPAAPAPGTAPAGDVVVGSGSYSPIVQDLDKAIEFYGNLLGLTVPPPQTPGPRAFGSDPALLGMFGMPGAEMRYVTARIPGSTVGVEMVELKGIDRKPVRPRAQDPGGTTLVLLVRDIESAFAPLKKAGVPVMTPGARPMAFGQNQGARGVIVSDPDGHFVELLQLAQIPETTAPPDSNIIGARVRVTVADTEKAMRVYRDVLHFDPQSGSFATSPLVDMVGLKGADARLTTASFPGSVLRMEFVELKGVSRTAIQPRLQDPGATRLQVRVRDINATIEKLKGAGSSVVSTGGEPVTLQGGRRAAIMRDADGLFLVLIQ